MFKQLAALALCMRDGPIGDVDTLGRVPAAAWTWRAVIGRFVGFGLLDRYSNAQQSAGERHGVLVRRTGEQAIVPDAVETMR